MPKEITRAIVRRLLKDVAVDCLQTDNSHPRSPNEILEKIWVDAPTGQIASNMSGTATITTSVIIAFFCHHDLYRSAT